MRLIKRTSPADPYFNLAAEDFLVNGSLSDEGILFMYVNEPAVVCGRNQNIWQECDTAFCKEHQVNLCRRVSGGGTVFHDRGNLNIALIESVDLKKVNRYENLLHPVTEAMRKYAADITVNERNDLVCGAFKLSGSAQFTTRRLMITHCTLLIHADLDLLSSALKSELNIVRSIARPSVRSKVANLSEISLKALSIETCANKIADAFATRHSLSEYDFTSEEVMEVNMKYCEKHKSNEWIFDRSPAFTFALNRSYRNKAPIEVEVVAGRIREIVVGADEKQKIETGLLGERLSEDPLSQLFLTD